MRKCGDCASCCTVLGVPGLKESHTICPHMRSCGTNRCGVYGTPEKPEPCTSYSCMWLAGHFTTRDKPNEIGVVFTAVEHPTGPIVQAHEVRLDAAKTGRGAALIAALSRGMPVVVVPADNGNRRLVCNHPQRAIDLRKMLREIGVHHP